MSKILLSTRLKNLVKKEGGTDYEYDLQNIVLNGVKKGCSGFITNPNNHLCVYVNTEHSCYHPLASKFMYRSAKDTKDFTGGTNLWADSEETLAKEIVRHLGSKVRCYE